MDFLKDVKVYHDGSHFIGIPKELQPWKKRKTHKNKTTVNKNEISKENESNVTECNLKEKFEKLYNENKNKKRKERFECITAELEKDLGKDKANEFVKANFERKQRNLIEQRKRLARKVRQQDWDYFCTFTYDDKLHSEDSFRKTLSNCLKHLSNRKGWKYVGVWERSPINQRLHFHGLIQAPQMVGEFIETKDYSTKDHKMQTAIQNTFFLKRFGRNDFKVIDSTEFDKSIQYLCKYIEKSGERIVYSKGLYTYFITDILTVDVICTTGQEDRKIILFDDFKCMDIETGEVIGQICKDTIDKLKKSN